MSPPPKRLTVSAPGRICLFGEHQDYLGLPVIAAAIALRIRIDGRRRRDREVHLDLPDTGGRETFLLAGRLPYRHHRDYFRSAVNVLHREGFTWSGGFDAVVRGAIPINAGASSSSALVVAWVRFLALMSDGGRDLAPPEVARLAHHAEVAEFDEPGGMMDHVASALGGVAFIRFAPETAWNRLPVPAGHFVLGDSGEPKDTKAVLARSKGRVMMLLDRLRREDPGFTLEGAAASGVSAFAGVLSPEERMLLEGVFRNRSITLEAREILSVPGAEPARVGPLLLEQQAILRDLLGVSTPKIDRMLAAAVGAGASGGKINGSGGGGCMVALVKGDPAPVAAAIAREGGKAYVVGVDEGVRVEMMEEES